MADTRTTLTNQFTRDVLMLTDALVGITASDLDDPSFGPSETLRERLALVAGHYWRMGEVFAYRQHRQADPPVHPDKAWRAELAENCADWALDQFQDDLDEAWDFYRDMLAEMGDNDLEWVMHHTTGAADRPAWETSRDISAWRLRRERQ
jgi:hypothetical protein